MKNTDFRLPTPKALYRGLLLSLGWATEFQPDVEIHCESIFLSTLRASGIDPDSVPEHLLYPSKGKANTPTLWRKFNLAFRYLKDAPQHGEPGMRCGQERKAYWYLTQWGVDWVNSLKLSDGEYDRLTASFSARECEDKRNDPGAENLTLIWFRDEWPKISDKVTKTLSQDRSLRRSTEMGLIEDHIGHFIARAIRNNTFFKILSAGGRIQPSKIASYIQRSAFSEIRGWGKDANCVSSRGALSATHRRKCQEWGDSQEFGAQTIGFSKSHLIENRFPKIVPNDSRLSEGDNRVDTVDYYGGNLAEEMDAQLAAYSALQEISSTIGRKLSRLPHAQTLIIVRLAWGEEMTVKEISANQDLPVSDVTAALQDVRRLCKQKFGSRENLLSHPQRTQSLRYSA